MTRASKSRLGEGCWGKGVGENCGPLARNRLIPATGAQAKSVGCSGQMSRLAGRGSEVDTKHGLVGQWFGLW